MVGKAASQTCPSTYQSFFLTLQKQWWSLLRPLCSVCHGMMLQFEVFGWNLSQQLYAGLAKSVVKELNLWLWQLLGPALAPTKVFETLQKQWWSLLRPHSLVCHVEMLAFWRLSGIKMSVQLCAGLDKSSM